MYLDQFKQNLRTEIQQLKEQGLYKSERALQTPQSNRIQADGKKVLNLCANNYLGLANHPTLIQTAQKALEERGFGLASVRFICGTQDIHKELEQRLSTFLGMEDTILYSSCFDANGGLFESILGEEDAVISDVLNHASIIDGIRLCKAARYRYKNNDMADLEEQLKAASGARFKLIATDGVFSMDGIIANLKGICDLAEKYNSLVMVDDSHAVGFMGKHGKGTHEFCDVMSRIDILTGTLGKALGGASGGYVAAKKEIVEWLRQKSRPYLFSNSLAPSIVQTSLAVLDLIENNPDLLIRLHNNASYFRSQMTQKGFKIIEGQHPIIPVMFGDAIVAKQVADEMMKEGVYVTAFSFPVVPKGQARIRTQMSAAHTKEDLDLAIAAFEKVGKKCGVI